MKSSGPSPLKYFTQLVKLSLSFKYQLLFLLYICLYNSTQYLNLHGQATLGEYSDYFILSIANNLSVQANQIIIVIIFILFVTSIFYIVSFKESDFSIEIFELLIFPFYAYLSLRQLIYYKNMNDITNSIMIIIWTVFLVISNILFFIICFLKNTKIEFRYEGIRQRNFNKLNSTFQITLLLKMVINFIFSYFLSTQILAYGILMLALTFLCQYLILKNVIYENPKIQYLLFIAQFWAWIPIAKTIIQSYFQLNLSPIAIYWIPFILLIVVGVFKPKFILKMLQNKYKIALTELKIQTLLKTQTKKSDYQYLNTVVLSVLIDMFIESNLTGFGSLKWSDTIKSQYLQFLTTHSTDDPSQFTQQKQLTKAQISSRRLAQSLKMVQNDQSSRSLQLLNESDNMLQQSAHSNELKCAEGSSHKKIIYELIWMYLKKENLLNDVSSFNLKYFLVYNFPDMINIMKLRMFICYFFNHRNYKKSTNNDFFYQLKNQITFNYLKAKIGNHQVFNKNSYGFEEFISINLHPSQQAVKQHGEPARNQMCLFKQNQYYNPNYNDLVRQNILFGEICHMFESFIKNQKLFLQIFVSIKQNKQNVHTYYDSRYFFRINITRKIAQYNKLQGKRPIVVIIFKYFSDVFLNKNILIGQNNFRQAFDNQTFFKKQKKIITQKRTGTQFHIPGKTMKNLYQKQPVFQVNQNLTCVVSGIKNQGNIVLVCQQFKQIFQLNFQNSLYLQNQASISINKLMLPLWNQKHHQLVKGIQNLQRPIQHVQQRYFMNSLKSSHVYEVKFKMYFFLKYESDLLIILDVSYQKIKNLIIKSIDGHKLHQYNATKNQKIRNHSEYEQQIVLFKQTYRICAIKQLISQDEPKSTKNSQIVVKTLMQINHQKDPPLAEQKQKKIFIQRSFEAYKTNFDRYGKGVCEILSLAFLSLFFFSIAYKIFLNYSNDAIMSLVSTVAAKQNIQDQFCLFSSFSIIDLGMILNTVEGRLSSMKKQQQTNMKSYLFDSLFRTNIQVAERYQSASYNNQSDLMTNNLFNPSWISNESISFISNSLLQGNYYYEAMSTFVNISRISQQNSQLAYYNKIANSDIANKSQILISLTQSNSAIYPTVSSSEIQSIINFNVTLTPKNTYELGNYVSVVEKNFQYFYGNNGVIDSLFNLENINFVNARFYINLFYWIIEIVHIIFHILLVWKVAHFKISMSTNYNYILNVSEQFLKKMEAQLFKFTQILKRLKSTPERKVLKSIAALKPTKNSQSNLILQCQKLQRKPYYDKNPQQINFLNYSAKSMKFALIRFFILIIILNVSYSDYNKSINQIEQYTSGITKLAITNGKLIHALQISLFSYNKGNVTTLKQNFDQLIDQIIRADVAENLDHIFFNDDAMNEFMYKNLCAQNYANQFSFPIQCYQAMRSDKNSYLSLKSASINSLIQLWNIIQQPQSSSNQTIYKVFSQSYARVSKVFHLTDQIDSYTVQLLINQVINEHNVMFYAIMIALAILYLMCIDHFYTLTLKFNQEFLRIANVEDLNMEEGLQVYVNLAQRMIHLPKTQQI